MLEKRYDPQKWEKEMQELWRREKTYQFRRDAKRPVYSIDTPPPTVSGSLHIGHLFSYAQAEMIARFHRMQGENVYYPFGFDDNGLPTERLVEREKHLRAKDLPREEFIALCRETAKKYEEEFRKLFESLGFSVDWSLQYETASPEMQRLSQAMFLELVQEGKAYCKEAPVLWCTQCQTSIAQAELETKEQASTFYTLAFSCEGHFLPVATTRPELLFGCLCLLVHPENPKYKDLIGKKATTPLYGVEVPILAEEEADPEKGSGIVMCASFGDSTDVQWVARHRLTPRKVLLPNGTFDPSVPFLSGLPVKAAREETVRLLREKGLLLGEEALTHTVAVHERCGTEVEILSSRQWYIEVISQKDRLKKAAEELNWHPEKRKEQYLAWVENLKWDWCISRQRYYGVPIPVWYCKNCGKPAFAKKEELPADPIAKEYGGVCSCGCKEFVPESAVLDTWATSSLTPLLHKSRGLSGYPLSMRTHAHEIIRTWTFYSILRSLYHTGELPWKDLMINGFVLAKPGEKISKSKGNGPSPSALIEEHSADVLRCWAANAKLGTDSFFSPKDLQPEKRLLTKLWNAARFAEPLLADYDPAAPFTFTPVDRWILEQGRAVMGRAKELLLVYEAGGARHEADTFFWKDFCDNYLELAKERLYSEASQKAALRRGAQRALFHGLFYALQLYAVYAPHITEAIYQTIFRAHMSSASLHETKWPAQRTPDRLLLQFGQCLKENLSEMRGQKTAQGLSLKAPMDEFLITAPPQLKPLFLQSREDLLACSRARSLGFRPA